MSDQAIAGGIQYRYRFGDVEFDEARFDLRVDGHAIEIQPKPLELLALLLRNAGEVVTTQEIFESVWKNPNARQLETNVLGMAISKVRSALGKQSRRIVTVPRVGYRFDGRLERITVGRRLSSGIALEIGMPVPQRNNFVLEELLSRTNYSEVWRARNCKTGERRVYKFSPDGACLATLKREATIYRLLRETLGARDDFVQIIDWNFGESPFFLECQDGGANLRQWADNDPWLRQASVSDRLSLFLQIADAVAAAHSVGVLHKDLKPDNVLITRVGEGWQVKLTDFGSGHLLDPEQLSALNITLLGLTSAQGLDSNNPIGTAMYLAPELVKGDSPTTKSDVYALGILLCQVLVGDMRRLLVPGWQRAIEDPLLQLDIAAATDGDPTHRLNSAAELAAELRRLPVRRAEKVLEQQTVELARLAQDQLRRARTRRPWLIASIATLLLGSAISTSLFFESRRAFLAADEQRTRAEAINQFLDVDLLAAADPSGPAGQHDATVKTLLSRAAARVDSRFGKDEISKASINLALGDAYFGLSDYASASVFQRRGFSALAQAKGASDVATLRAEYALVRTLAVEGRYLEAAQLLNQADSASEVSPTTWSELGLLAYWTRGNVLLMQMKPDAALVAFQHAESIRLNKVPADERWLFRVRDGLAWCYVRLGRNNDAIAALEQLMSSTYTIQGLGATDWEKARLQYALALSNVERYDDAEKVLKESLTDVKRILGTSHYVTGLVWNHLGSVYQAEGRWDDAADAQQHALEIMRECVGPDAQATLGVAAERAAALYLSGHVDEALPLLQAAYEKLREKLGREAPLAQDAGYYYASALLTAGDSAKAEAIAAGLQGDALNSVDPDNNWPDRLAGLRGAILMKRGDPSTGERMLESALDGLTQRRAPQWAIAPIKSALDGFRGGDVVGKSNSRRIANR